VTPQPTRLTPIVVNPKAEGTVDIDDLLIIALVDAMTTYNTSMTLTVGHILSTASVILYSVYNHALTDEAILSVCEV